VTECDVARPFGASPRLRTVWSLEQAKPDHYFSRPSQTPVCATLVIRTGLASCTLSPSEAARRVRWRTTRKPRIYTSPNQCCGLEALALYLSSVLRVRAVTRIRKGRLCRAALSSFWIRPSHKNVKRREIDTPTK